MDIFEYYIQEEFHLTRAIEQYNRNEDSEFTLKTFKEKIQKDNEFRERFEECKQLEKDQVKMALKKLCIGIPITDKEDEIIGWQEKPDLKAIQQFLLKIDRS